MVMRFSFDKTLGGAHKKTHWIAPVGFAFHNLRSAYTSRAFTRLT